jgi:hypothetical protein
VDSKQVGLVDSIFRNYYIPPIIFGTYTHPSLGRAAQRSAAVTSYDDGTVLRTCIDGKQVRELLSLADGPPLTHREQRLSSIKACVPSPCLVRPLR